MILFSSNPIIDAYLVSDLFGKIIFLSLTLLSIVTWTIFFKKFFVFREARLNSYAWQAYFQKRRSHPLSIDKQEEHPFAQIYTILKQNTLELLEKNRTVLDKKNATLSRSDIELIDAHLANTISLQAKKMEKNLFLLSTIVSLAPFLGLLGTVWGILLTFNELQANTAINTNVTIMGGLAMALGTTVAGLLVAIPALIAYNYLRSSVAQFVGEMENFSNLLLASVELQYRQVDIIPLP